VWATAVGLARVACIAGLVWTAAMDVAWAGGLEVGDSGAEAVGRGGAFVAKADSPAAVNYNPAGFAKLGGHHVALSLSAVNSDVAFLRMSDNPNQVYPQVTNGKSWFVAPMHGMVTTDLGVFRNLTFALGFYAPSATPKDYSATLSVNGKEVPAPQRYDTTSTGGVIVFPTLAAAYRVARWLDVGASLQWNITRISTTTIGMVAAACPETPEDPTCDVTMRINAKSGFAPTGSMGVLMRLGSSLEFGAMLRFPSQATLHGRAEVEFGQAVQRLGESMAKKLLEPENPTVSISNGYPTMLRFGGRRIFRKDGEEWADIEFNLAYENWSSVSRRRVQVDAQSLGQPMAPLEVDYKMRDTVSLRLGGAMHWNVGRWFAVVPRAGVFYESASTAVSDTSLQVLGPRRIGVAAGLGFVLGRMIVNVAYTHIFLPTRFVENSSVRALNIGSEEPGPVVGNGIYRARVQALLVQLAVAYGKARRTLPVEETWHEPAGKPRDDANEEGEDPTVTRTLGATQGRTPGGALAGQDDGVGPVARTSTSEGRSDAPSWGAGAQEGVSQTPCKHCRASLKGKARKQAWDGPRFKEQKGKRILSLGKRASGRAARGSRAVLLRQRQGRVLGQAVTVWRGTAAGVRRGEP